MLSIPNKLTHLLGLLITLMYAFPLFKENISSMLFMATGILSILYVSNKRKFKLDRRILFFTIPFFIILIRIVFEANLLDDLLPLKNALFFLFFPFVFMCLPNHLFSNNKLNIYFNVLRGSCALISLGYLFMFLYFYDFKDFFIYKYNIPRFRDFVYNETPVFKIHPTYFTTILLFCTAFSFEKFRKRDAWQIYNLFYIALFVCLNFLLLAKLNLFLVVLLLFFSIIFRSGYSISQKTIITLTSAIVIIALAVSVPGIKNRFTEIFTSFSKPPVGLAYDSTNVRMAILHCSKDIAADNLLWGVGFNNTAEAFRNCFKNNYLSDFFVDKNYMSHNYYIYMLISGGIFAALAFISFVVFTIKIVVETKSYLLAIMVISVLAINFTEDYFYRHYGQFFFCLVFFTIYRNSKFNQAIKVDASL